MLFIDPYGVSGAPLIEGINARKSRAHEDGYRIATSHEIMATQAGTIAMGSSRIVDGFPDELSYWDGGFANMGISGTSAFELSRASLLAAENENIQCVIIGIDSREFGTDTLAKATYWLTTFDGGSRAASLTRTALAPHAFARALQTFIDNMTGGEDTAWVNAYREDLMRAEFDEEVDKRYRYYLNFEYNQDRIEFLFRGIDALLAADKQVAVFIHPRHGWQEEATQRAGSGYVEEIMRRDLAAAADARSHLPRPDNACFNAGGLSVWDFAGFRPISTTPPPDESGEHPNPWFHEPSHYRDIVGESIMNWLAGTPLENGAPHEDFGERLTTETVDSVIAGLHARRESWLGQTNDPWVEYLNGRFDELDANPPSPEAQPSIFLTPSQWSSLNSAVERIERANAD